ncbi:MAG: ATP-binding protein [Chloroflexi bacterium]|nr:ATP-binding protein [Chloroflexota bacterium]
MENLGDILKRLETTRDSSLDRPPSEPLEDTADREKCPICGDKGWFSLDLPVGHSEFGRAITCECQDSLIREERSLRLLRYSNLGNLTRFTFESLDPDGRTEDPENRLLFNEAYDAAKRFAESPSGWLVFIGPHGAGKTHLAAAAANQCIENNSVVFFVHVPDLMDHLRSTFGPTSDISYSELFDQVKNTPVLVLDGLDSHTSTPWAEEKLRQIVNHRFNSELPTLITSAAGLDELDPYIRSRIQGMGTTSKIMEVRSRESIQVHGLGRIDGQMLNRMTFDTFDVRGNNPSAGQRASLEAAYQAAKNFADDPDGWLTFFGNTGVGKTHLAVAIAGERRKRGHAAFFAFVPELLDYLRYTFSPESRVTYDRIFDEVKNTPLLILDDLGQEHGSPWADEKLYQIIVHRHNTRQPTVVTSMLDFADHTGPIGSRVRDQSVGQLIRIDTPDFRITPRSSRRRSARSSSR